jgi:sulfate/thiosulfate transport system permease protein
VATPASTPDVAVRVPRRAKPHSDRAATALSVGFVTTFLTVLVALPLAALIWEATSEGSQSFWDAVSSPEAVAALKLTLVASLAISLLNAVLGTTTAWVLVRDDFRGKSLVNAIIDLPFALPTIVAGLTLLALYGPTSPIDINVAFTQTAIVLCLMFVTLPFVVRTVQPVLEELEVDAEEAASSLGASRFTVFKRIILPSLVPAIAAGAALSFARAISEYGALVLLSGNRPFQTEVVSVRVLSFIENGNLTSAAAVASVMLFVALFVIVALDIVQRRVARRG